MKFGVCADVAAAAPLAVAGFDYLELNVQKQLRPEQEESQLRDEWRAIRAAPLPAEAACCFLPGDLKVCGPTVDGARVLRYVESAMARAERIGIHVIVFGSGAARAVPAGQDPRQAWRQLVDFARQAGGAAARYGITLVVEPLNTRECNILTSVAEGARSLSALR